jgi:AraC-like DNA-binding protein
MSLKKLSKVYEISEKGFPKGSLPPLKQLFYQIMWIKSGTGELIVNANRGSVRRGDILLLKPGDAIEGRVDETIQCDCLRFYSIYFSGRDKTNLGPDYSALFARFEYLLYGHQNLFFIRDIGQQDRTLLDALFARLMEEYLDQAERREVFIRSLVVVLLHLLIQNVRRSVPSGRISPRGRVEDILDFIHYNIYDHRKISIRNLSLEFHLSREALMRQFKKTTGMSIKQWILQYKIQLGEERLAHSEMRASEIAYELGFTDLSHFYKTFQRFRKMSPGTFRRHEKRKVETSG